MWSWPFKNNNNNKQTVTALTLPSLSSSAGPWSVLTGPHPWLQQRPLSSIRDILCQAFCLSHSFSLAHLHIQVSHTSCLPASLSHLSPSAFMSIQSEWFCRSRSSTDKWRAFCLQCLSGAIFHSPLSTWSFFPSLSWGNGWDNNRYKHLFIRPHAFRSFLEMSMWQGMCQSTNALNLGLFL